MKKSKQKLFVFISIIFLLLLSACSQNTQDATSGKGKSSGSSSNGGKAIYIGMTTPPSQLNPINAKELNTQILSSILFESLFELDNSMEFLPKLGESMETEDNQNFVIKLNPKVKWTDGEPFTTEDIAFTLQTMANPKVVSVGLQSLSIIEGLSDNGTLPDGETEITGIEIIDPHTFNVHTKVPVDINFLKEKLGVDIRFLPKHVLKDVDPENLHQDPFMRNPNVTNGAFKLVKIANDQYVEFAANNDYYRGKPKLDKLFFKVLPSTNLVAQLQTGEIQMNSPSIGPIATDDLERVKNMSNVTLTTGESLFAQQLFVNLETITDKRVRQAIVQAIDRKVIVENVQHGMGEVTDGPYPPAHPYFNKDKEVYAYNPEKAKELLKAAGWDFNKTIDFAVPTGNKAREQAATIIAENLKEIGMKVEINKYDLPTALQKGAKHEFDLLFIGIPFTLDPDRSIYYQTGGPYNFSGYSNPQVDKLINEGRMEVNPEKRHVIYEQMVDILHDELPNITLYSLNSPGAVSNKVKVGEPKDYGMYYNIHEWDIEN
ncbi:ABC transporter substrate-binding protein [Psychrobacillus sp. L3]|uniref:ABC transporter substrate-binding protein n=1 Tax=Psychrobacillus sp. L3 TaxID=3236891 RepID=UPI0036F2CB52